MSKMLIDARHPEETRVVVLKGNRIEEFDFESADKKQLKGNIYLAKVTRVEPSLQAAFVEYGGNRHGFLAFSEIHPDYYQIPHEDREALLREEVAEHEDEDERGGEKRQRRRGRRFDRSRRRKDRSPESLPTGDAPVAAGDAPESAGEDDPTVVMTESTGLDVQSVTQEAPFADHAEPQEALADDAHPQGDDDAAVGDDHHDDDDDDHDDEEEAGVAEAALDPEEHHDAEDEHHDDDHHDDDHEDEEESEVIEAGASDEATEEAARRRRSLLRRRYKIQEVIKRRQILLVQVVKEERGGKGAALTTYLSLAGRYCVLMPNTTHGGGISRKISSTGDRKRLKEIMQDMELPKGMGCIIRTAGLARTRGEIRRDFDYLTRLWDIIRDTTLQSVAPALIYEDSSLIKRAIRDIYNKEVDDILVDGDESYRAAKEYMRLLMPSHARRVQLYKDRTPLFQRFGVEAQLESMYHPTVQLRSGGYIVINPTEALVSIDINSGRATREHNIEETAVKTNCEAADEIARQLRLRDMAGLVVIDFIDMEERGNIRQVERRLKDALKNDRARIQIGRISNFGLMEMSRQRLRTGVLEASTHECPTCKGTGFVRSVSSSALFALRGLEEEAARLRSAQITLHVPSDVAIYILNNKRAEIADIEDRFGIDVLVMPKAALLVPMFELERFGAGPARPVKAIEPAPAEPDEPEIEDEEMEDDEPLLSGDESDEDEAEDEREARTERDDDRNRRGRGRGRGRRRRSRGDTEPRTGDAPAEEEGDAAAAPDGETAEAAGHDAADAAKAEAEESERRRRRRGRRGGRRRRIGEGESEAEAASEGAETPEVEASDEASEQAGEQSEPVVVEPVLTPALPVAQPEIAAVEPAVAQPAAAVAEIERAPAIPEGVVVDASVRSEEAASDQPVRKGWWQRTFG